MRPISLLDIIGGKAGGLPTSATNATSYIDTPDMAIRLPTGQSRVIVA